MKIHLSKSDLKILRQTAIFIVPVFIYVTLICVGLAVEGGQQFSELANAFLHGHTNFLHSIGGLGQDPVYYHGKIYWDEGAFPAVLLMPFVAVFKLFHAYFYQGYLKWALVLGVAFFVYQLARKFKYSAEDSLILVFGFSLGSVFIGADSVSSSWLFAQVVTTFVLFWALYEYFNKRRWWLIGVICALVLLSRVTAAPILIFFALAICFGKMARAEKITSGIKLLVPVAIGLLIIFSYNYQRYHDPFQNGNQYQLLSSESSEARAMGLFSFDHIPTNLYTALLRGPIPVLRDNTSWSLKFPYIDNNPLGISIILTSPYLLYLFSKRLKQYPTEAKWLLVATGVSALIVLTYFGDGGDQFGYRYSLDFMPGLFAVFMMVYKRNHKSLTTGMKTLLLGSGVVNFYILCTYVK